MADARNDKTRAAVKAALLRLLQQKPFEKIGMSETAKEAGISRSALYANYPNLQQAFDDLLVDFHSRMQPLNMRLRCAGCEEQAQAAARGSTRAW